MPTVRPAPPPSPPSPFSSAVPSPPSDSPGSPAEHPASASAPAIVRAAPALRIPRMSSPSKWPRAGRSFPTVSVRQQLGQEVLGPRRPRVGEELLGRALLDDLTVVHEHDEIGRAH